MSESAWMPRLLFRLACGLSALLFAAVLVAPWLAPADPGPDAWSRLLSLFAHDAAVRRICLASALGLLTTACVFFRPPPAPPSDPSDITSPV